METVLAMNKLLVEGRDDAPPPPRSARSRLPRPAPPPTRAAAAPTRSSAPSRSRTTSKPKRRAKKTRDVEARPLPWVPSSAADGGVSFNLAAACNYALRKTQHPVPRD